jgi:hypothetical protein
VKELIAQGWLIVFGVLCVAVVYGAIAATFEALTVAWKIDEAKRLHLGWAERPSPWFVRAYHVIEPRRRP